MPAKPTTSNKKTRNRSTKRGREDGGQPTSSRKRQRPQAPPPRRLPQDGAVTDPKLVTGPVLNLVNPAMEHAWEVNNLNQMCFIFDYTSPCRRFKIGSLCDPVLEEPFPEYEPNRWEDPNVTETDRDEAPGLQNYYPEDYWCVHPCQNFSSLLLRTAVLSPQYRFECDITAEAFTNWSKDQLHTVKFGKIRKRPNKKPYEVTFRAKGIPVPYARLVHQFILEDDQCKYDQGHEPRRRQTYVQEVLDHFGTELEGYKGPSRDFRSKVLTPILQRQFWGVSEDYAPSVRGFISTNGEALTISGVTEFYLGRDPVDPEIIPTFCRNLIYLPQARWHLGIVMGKFDHGSIEDYEMILDNHGIIMAGLRGGGTPKPADGQGIPPLNQVEAKVITEEKLNEFFADVLRYFVCGILCPYLLMSSSHLPKGPGGPTDHPGSTPGPSQHKEEFNSSSPAMKTVEVPGHNLMDNAGYETDPETDGDE